LVRGDLMMFDDLGKEWKDDKWATKMNSLILLLATLGAATIWLTMPEQQTTAMIFILMGVFMAILGGLDTANENHPTVGAVGFGSKNRALIAILAGVVGAFLLTGFSFSIVHPITVVSTLSLVYVVLFSPILEEFFFRGGLLFTLGKQVPGVVAVLLQAVLFGSWHYVAYSGSQEAMFTAVVFGIFMAVGNYTFKSLGFSVAFHMVYNYLVVSG
jgi:membrane protease YdiL (CAAX protease family)